MDIERLQTLAREGDLEASLELERWEARQGLSPTIRRRAWSRIEAGEPWDAAVDGEIRPVVAARVYSLFCEPYNKPRHLVRPLRAPLLWSRELARMIALDLFREINVLLDDVASVYVHGGVGDITEEILDAIGPGDPDGLSLQVDELLGDNRLRIGGQCLNALFSANPYWSVSALAGHLVRVRNPIHIVGVDDELYAEMSARILQHLLGVSNLGRRYLERFP